MWNEVKFKSVQTLPRITHLTHRKSYLPQFTWKFDQSEIIKVIICSNLVLSTFIWLVMWCTRFNILFVYVEYAMTYRVIVAQLRWYSIHCICIVMNYKMMKASHHAAINGFPQEDSSHTFLVTYCPYTLCLHLEWTILKVRMIVRSIMDDWLQIRAVVEPQMMLFHLFCNSLLPEHIPTLWLHSN